MDNNQPMHVFEDIAADAITETFTPSAVQRSKVLTVNLKFSDVLTQDTLYIRRLDKNDHVLEEYGVVLFEESATATFFTWVPPVDAMKIAPTEQVQVAFLNEDDRTLSVPESNVTYEFI